MRISHKSIIAAVLLTLMALLLPASVAVADEVVTFPDPNLEAAIRETIGKPTGDIYQSDLEALTALHASLKGIQDLSGLEYCGNLTSLYLTNNQISDISPLGNLTSLTWLWLYSNQISDISPLSGLTSLTSLHLYNNRISDLSPLSGLTSMTFLYLDNNRISDISPLSGLTSLTFLYLALNQISDIQPLVNNPGLSNGDFVDLRANPLSADSLNTYIPQLQARDVEMLYGLGGGCFIATAAYGSSMDSSVETLRTFRDRYLVPNPVGSALVSTYYKLSPPVAEFIEDHPALKPMVRVGLLPAIALSTVAVNTTVAEKMAIVGFALLVSALAVVWLRRKAVRGKF